MKKRTSIPSKRLVQTAAPSDTPELLEPVPFHFGLKRRAFVQILSTGLLVAAALPAAAQRSRGGGRPSRLDARVKLGKNGEITVFSGKVEGGQGARTELALAAAEELRVPVEQVQMVLADTQLVPDDGSTAGSRTTPGTVPAVRQAAATARELLIDVAAQRWSVPRDTIKVADGKAVSGQRSFTYAELAQSEEAAKAFSSATPRDVPLTSPREWKALGKSRPRINGRDIVTGAHQFPSDITRPGMLYGKVLRPPSMGARLLSVDLGPAKQMKGVAVVQDENFVGVAAPTSALAAEAVAAIAKSARWESTPQPSSAGIFDYLDKHAQGGIPENPFPQELAAAKHKLRQVYHTAYVQHAPLEPRVAVAEWKDGALTVWAGTQNPFGYRSELARAFRLGEDRVRVIVPDFGAGFGGKHTGEAAVEAARLAQGAGKPVALHWTREEEFTWAYFRPAAVIHIEAGLNAKGALTSWHFVNVNSGGASIDTPYRTGKSRSQFVSSNSPLRQGSYRSLAAAANNFARESFMDELAAAAGADPLKFRVAHLEGPDRTRLRTVLETAAQRFEWEKCLKTKTPNRGFGLACGTDKGSFVATCAEVEIDKGQISVRRVCEVFDCGAVLNPGNLLAQVRGAIIMGLGPALREEMRFEKGEMQNASFRRYSVPRFLDVPEIDIHILDQRDVPSAGGGETPIIGIAPAIANAVCNATGVRVRQLPIKLT